MLFASRSGWTPGLCHVWLMKAISARFMTTRSASILCFHRDSGWREHLSHIHGINRSAYTIRQYHEIIDRYRFLDSIIMTIRSTINKSQNTT